MALGSRRWALGKTKNKKTEDGETFRIADFEFNPPWRTKRKYRRWALGKNKISWKEHIACL